MAARVRARVPAHRRRAALLVVAGVVALHAVWLGGFGPPRDPARLEARAPLVVRIEVAKATDDIVARDQPQADRPQSPADRDRPPAEHARPVPRAVKPAGGMSVPPADAGAARSVESFISPSAARPATDPTAVSREAAADTPSAEPSPVYPTALPPSGTLHYELRRGDARGAAELAWQRDGDRYEARFDATVGGSPWLRWSSRGRIDAAGVAPERFVDRRRGRGAQAANFDREAGRIGFSGAGLEHALPPGAQDRLTWWLQLAAIAAADPAGLVPGRRLRVFVAGARGDADWWEFEVMGFDEPAAPGAASPRRLVREPQRPYDTRAEVWLDPARHWLPARVRLSRRDDGRDALELQRRDPEPAEGSAGPGHPRP